MFKSIVSLCSAIAIFLAATPVFSKTSNGTGVHATFGTPGVALIECGDYSGSGSFVTNTKVVTAYHVVSTGSACTVNGEKAEIFYKDGPTDLAILTVADHPRHISQISCAGFNASTVYQAVGYAGPNIFIASYLLPTTKYAEMGPDESTIYPSDHLRVLHGRVFAGMSGGPIVDKNGVVVGTVIGGSSYRTFSRQLKDTVLCHK